LQPAEDSLVRDARSLCGPFGGMFALRASADLNAFGFSKTIRGTLFARWNTWLYSPLCVVIAVLAAGLARR